jgi:1-deoxy-D-xylulose-5-phosphate synthase
MDAEPRPLPLGRGRLLKDGGAQPDVAVLALGPCAHAAAAAAEALARDGIAATVVDARFVKPLDEDLLCAAAAAAHRVLTVEEGALAGGFGAGVLELLERKGLLPRVQVRRLGLPDQFVSHGDAQKQRAQLGLDAAGIARACREITGIQPNVAERGLA